MSYLGARLNARPRNSARSVNQQGWAIQPLHEINAPARLCTWPDLYVSACCETGFTGLVWRIDSCRFFNARGQAFARGYLPCCVHKGPQGKFMFRSVKELDRTFLHR